MTKSNSPTPLSEAVETAQEILDYARTLAQLNAPSDHVTWARWVKTIETLLDAVAEGREDTDELLRAYRDKRACDGLNGRTWDAMRHREAERGVARLEALATRAESPRSAE